jgi:hypothetical protein
MCEYCDLYLGDDGEKRIATLKAKRIATLAYEVYTGYTGILCGTLKPHTKEMAEFVNGTERSLVKALIDDVL